MVAKVTVSMADELLETLDREADAQGVSRSALVSDALEALLGTALRARAAEERHSLISAAIVGMREMSARNPGLDGRAPQAVLRETRAKGDAARGGGR